MQAIDRGFACLGLYRPKHPENVGAVMRAAHCYRVAQVNIVGGRNHYLRHATNTPMAHRHTPVFLVEDLLSYVPFGTQIVAVDLIPGAVPLTTFVHPERALGIMAEVVARDLAALPIFERIDREWRAARETVALRDRDDPVEKARALVRLRKEARV